MATIKITFKRTSIACALVNVMIWLAACAPLPLAPSGAESSSNNAVAQGYPAPGGTVTPAPLPTLLGGTPRAAVILVPDDIVAVSNVTQLPTETQPQPRYSVEIESIGRDTLKPALYVVDSQTGNKVRLGDDSGVTRFGAMDDKHIIWFFLCESCPNTGFGLYAYNLNTGKNVLIATSFLYTINEIKISNQWVTYISPESHYVNSHAMYAYNLTTGDTIRIADDVLSPGGSWGAIFSPINENKIAWLAPDLVAHGYVIKVYDFVTKTTSEDIRPQKLSIPRDLSVSQNLVVWQEGGWQGYDFAHNALFTVPVVPPGWAPDSVQRVGLVMAKGNQVFWEIESNGKTYMLSGEISEMQPKPTLQPVSGLSTPTVLPKPTSYP